MDFLFISAGQCLPCVSCDVLYPFENEERMERNSLGKEKNKIIVFCGAVLVSVLVGRSYGAPVQVGNAFSSGAGPAAIVGRDIGSPR